jgi:hypothetical protein
VSVINGHPPYLSQTQNTRFVIKNSGRKLWLNRDLRSGG